MSYRLLICNHSTSSGSCKQKGDSYRMVIAHRVREDKRSRLGNYTAKNNAMTANHVTANDNKATTVPPHPHQTGEVPSQPPQKN